MIHFERVSKRYDGAREALKGVTLDVADGELAFLTGRSGAGKSTVLKLIGLIEHATRGTVTVGGHNLARLKNRAIPAHRQQIGMVFQDNKLLADRSAYENVALPLIITGVGARDIGRRVRAALDQVGLLDRERLPPRSLSAGEQQRVGIARAIVNRPKVVIADEPTGNLDPDLALEVMLLFKRLNAAGTTMLIATHDLHLVEHLGGRRIHLVDGQVGGTAGEATP
ncbi:MAG: cell division ATP-binding protein FtsE [Gammaproteobacteria bacterium PRO9]|nr:cell division ATP-binding protein FtsE [Gammaproteobacteria bacterium PRO9]